MSQRNKISVAAGGGEKIMPLWEERGKCFCVSETNTEDAINQYVVLHPGSSNLDNRLTDSSRAYVVHPSNDVFVIFLKSFSMNFSAYGINAYSTV